MNKHLFVIFFMAFQGSVWAPISDGSELVFASQPPAPQRRVIPAAGCLDQREYWMPGQQLMQQRLIQNGDQGVPAQTEVDLVVPLVALRAAQR